MARGRDDGGRVIELTMVHSRAEAEMLVSLLRSEGLRAMSSADDGGGWGPNVGIEGVRVLVLEDDLAAATEVLNRDVQGPPGRREAAAGPPRPTKRRPAR